MGYKVVSMLLLLIQIFQSPEPLILFIYTCMLYVSCQLIHLVSQYKYIEMSYSGSKAG